MTKRDRNLILLAFAAAGLVAFLVGFVYNVVAAAAGDAVAAAEATAQRSESTAQTEKPAVRVQPLELFHETYDLVRRHYRLAGTEQWTNADRDRKLLFAALDGMLRSLGDPYTRFLDPDAYKEMLEQNKGSFFGIGAFLKLALDGKHILLAPIPNGPAAQAGLKVGDILLKINDLDAVGMSVEKARDLIRGPEGTKVELTVGRLADNAKPIGEGNPMKQVKIVVERAVIKPEEIQYQAGPPAGHEKDTDIGYIALKQFNEDTENQLDAALSALVKKNVKGLIVDLRGNPGGLLESAVAVASRFLDGKPVVIIQESGGQRQTRNADRGRYRRLNRPIVVLVNKGSASASEIVAGALRDHGAATLVGETTFGKGMVQTIIPVDADGSTGALKVTTAKYLTPNGTDINHKGIHPDVEVKGTVAENDPFAAVQTPQTDAQLDKAIEVLREQMAGKDTRVAAGMGN
ncbi:MAG: S41 family peptidase [Armatimonadota bacterium]|nr:S41 family peptidase [Armatimonadota bacterium]